MIKFFISCCTTNRFYAIILNITADKHNICLSDNSEVDETEELIAKSELNKVDLKVFLREIRKCTDIKELLHLMNEICNEKSA